MTRKEEIINAAYNEAEVERQIKIHPQVFEQGFVAGAKCAWQSGYKEAIEKACEWLDCYIDNYLFIDAENKSGIKWDDFINDFRKAMKGGEG